MVNITKKENEQRCCIMINEKIEIARINFARRSHKHVDVNWQFQEGIELIEKAYRQLGESLAVGWSAGQCSTVVLHMALQVNPKIKVVLNDTTVLYPQDYEYVKTVCSKFGIEHQLSITKPVKPFWDCIKEYGLPTIRRAYYHMDRNRRSFQEKRGKPACCWFCKDKPFLLWAKANNVKGTLTGLRACESRARQYYAADYGTEHFTKRQNMWKFNPILFWTTKQIKEYFIEHNIPQNKVYTELGLPRNGCQPCTGFLSWEKQLAKTNLKMYRYIQSLRGQKMIDMYNNDLERENELVDNCVKESVETII